MSDVVATVLVPTHDHGRLLSLSVRSALDQSIDAIEVFVICDGATQETLEAAFALDESDERVRLFVHDKGPRHGEIYRHQALQEARGDIVCYLSDDDLWLPGHVANMAGLLESSDFAHAYPIGLDVDGNLFSWPGHLSVPAARAAVLEGRNFIPLPCAAHTLELYHRLPYGWRTTPPDIHTDLYMWQQILMVDGVRLASGEEATVLHFPASLRGEVPLDERFEELARWSAASRDPAFPEEINRRARRHLAVAWVETEVHSRNLSDELDAATVAINRMATQQHQVEAERDKLDAERESLAMELAEAIEHTASLERRVGELSSKLGWITGTRTWRTREAMLRIPGVAWLLRTVGAARSR